MAKQTRLPHPPSETEYSLLTLVHSDIIGPLPLASDGSKYIISYIEHRSRYAKSFPIGSKLSETALACFKQYKSLLENQTGQRIKIHRTDRGGEYLSGTFVDFLNESGIISQLTIRDTPA